MTSTILVTGGAGYIGSHVVRQLCSRGETVVVLDDLSTGFADAVGDAELVIGDIGNPSILDGVFRRHAIDCVMHLAARTIVPESLDKPLAYYRNNTEATRVLLQCCQRYQLKQFIFSSTAAVYGTPGDGIASEQTPTQPINPYGRSKLAAEWVLKDLAAASDIRFVTLRYFNVAGCHPDLGQRTRHATLLIKVAAEVAVGRRQSLNIFGSDYATADGTGVRDYVHVEDIASAHLKALDYLRQGGASQTLNCGYGHGASVREVVKAVEQVIAQPLAVTLAPRRPGDPARLIAQAKNIRARLGWEPQHDDLITMVRSVIDWERRTPV